MMCWPARSSRMSTGALPLASPSTNTSTSVSLAMTRSEPTDAVCASVAATLVCWPATTVTDCRHGGDPTTRTSTI